MAQEPARIRDDIELTRTDLARDVDALADRTLPNRVARRRWGDMKAKARSFSDKIMGTPNGGHRIAEKTGDMADEVASAVREAPHAVAQRTQGNPVAAGIIAFGVGLLTASLIPATEMERRAGEMLRANADDLIEPIKQPLADSAQQIKDDVTDAVTVAVDEVKQTARDAANATKEEAKGAAEDVRDQTKDAVRQAS